MGKVKTCFELNTRATTQGSEPGTCRALCHRVLNPKTLSQSTKWPRVDCSQSEMEQKLGGRRGWAKGCYGEGGGEGEERSGSSSLLEILAIWRLQSSLSASDSMGVLRRCTARMSARPPSSGKGTTTRLDRRPGLVRAGSSTCTPHSPCAIVLTSQWQMG